METTEAIANFTRGNIPFLYNKDFPDNGILNMQAIPQKFTVYINEE